MKTVIMIAIIVLASSAGDVLITRGMKQVGAVSTIRPRGLLVIGAKVFSNRNYLAGLACLALSFLAFLAVLSWADLSFVIPATSLGYVISTLGARFILKEHINHLRWLGTLLVCLGVMLISLP